MSHANFNTIPAWTWGLPVAALLLAVSKAAGVVPGDATWALLLAALLLGAAIFASVHHAEVLAARVGEPLGSILLAGAVTVIEVAMVASIMLSTVEGSETVARDTVFSAIMIVLNGVIGLCLVVGGRRHYEQNFKSNAASSALAVLGTLAILVFVLSNFTVAGGERQYSGIQSAVIAIVTLGLYSVFLFVQTVRHREDFLDRDAAFEDSSTHLIPPPRITAASAVLLPLALAAVVLLAKLLSYPLDAAVTAAGLPQAVVGVVIAAIVLTPEGIASVRAAKHNRLQGSINLGLGSALASIGMTIPVVIAIALVTGRPLVLGLESGHMVLLVLTLFVSTLTLGTGRTTILQGAVHLTIFAVFLTMMAMP